MARDYFNRSAGNRSNGRSAKNGGKHDGKKGSRSTAKRRPAAKPNRSRARQTGSGTPGWLWLVCGLCIGLTIAAAFYVFGRPTGSDTRDQVAIDVPAAAQDEPDKAPDSAGTEKEQQEPRFAFYKMLPNYEVVIPEEEYPDDSGDTDSAEASAPVEPQPTTPKVRESGRFVIQAGSFSTYEDANRRKAELALLGIEAHIVSFDLDSGKTVYRVQSRTIESNDRLNELLKRLRENRIDTLVMQRKN